MAARQRGWKLPCWLEQKEPDGAEQMSTKGAVKGTALAPDRRGARSVSGEQKQRLKRYTALLEGEQDERGGEGGER
jgi:hypothetical protein